MFQTVSLEFLLLSGFNIQTNEEVAMKLVSCCLLISICLFAVH